MTFPRAAALVLFVLPLWPACTCQSSSGSSAGAGGAAVSATASAAPAPAVSGAEVSTRDPDVKPVYPPLDGPPHPLAQRLCDAFYALPSQRRSECCEHKPGPGVESECLRNLTGALKSGAVVLDESALVVCEDAMKQSLVGCDWVVPFPLNPTLPAACLGLLKGTKKPGSVCRSSLECEGNYNCAGVGPTSPGRCMIPRDKGPCGPQVDPLVGYTMQSDTEQKHPQCNGFCDQRHCAPVLKEGETCTFNDACGPGHHCDGVCKKGEAGKEGEKCLGTRCVTGLRCDQGTCVAPKKEGESCERNEQCRGACTKKSGEGAAASKGTCSPQCSFSFPARSLGGPGRQLRKLAPRPKLER